MKRNLLTEHSISFKELICLIKDNKVSHLSFCNNTKGIDDVKIILIADALKQNDSLISLDLSESGIDVLGARAIIKALESNTTLLELNLGSYSVAQAGLYNINNINALLRRNQLMKELSDIVDECSAKNNVDLSDFPVGMNSPQFRKFYERIATTNYNDPDYAATQEFIVVTLNLNIKASADDGNPAIKLMQLLHAQILAKALNDSDHRKVNLVEAIAQKKRELSLQCTAKPVENPVSFSHKDTSVKNGLPKPKVRG